MWVLRDLVKTSAFPRCAQVLAESESVIDLIIILFGREEILKVIFFFVPLSNAEHHRKDNVYS